MSVEVFWISTNRPGRIGIATRPRGGDWLKDDMRYLHTAGTDLLVSMLTPEEVREFQLEMEEDLCKEEGMRYQSVPIPDRGVPSTSGNLVGHALHWARLLENGTDIVVHCRQGIGRSALIVALVLVTCGVEVDHAFQIIAKARGRPVPDTEEQRVWVEEYAAGMHIVSGSKVAEQVERYRRASNAVPKKGESETTEGSELAQQGLPADTEDGAAEG